MTNGPSSGSSRSIPAAVEQLLLEHDETCDAMRVTTNAVISDLSQPVGREERHELASAIHDVAGELSALNETKREVGFYDGFGEQQTHRRERITHMQSEYRRLLNDLRRVQQEIATGKPPKARRQLTSWLSQLNDVLDREAVLIDELWNPSTDTAD